MSKTDLFVLKFDMSYLHKFDVKYPLSILRGE